MILDSHHHLWRYTPAEYRWIGDGMKSIARDFDVHDLRSVADPLGVVGSIAVQARQTIDETNDLIAASHQTGFVRGVVGWAPLAADDVSAVLDRWAGEAALRGLRHVVQDEPDDSFLDGEAFNRGVSEAVRRGLRYDILVFARQLPAAIRFVDRHPEGQFVLDHLAKPDVLRGEVGSWTRTLRELAERPNVMCKVSGIVTEADWSSWTLDTIRPFLDVVLEAFGPSRLMFGSDWPVCLLATEYERWLRTVIEWAEPLSHDEKSSICLSTACDFYGVEVPV